MRVSKSLRWVLYIVGGFISALILILILLSIIRIPIDLSSQKGMVESAASLALGRTVNIDDKIVVSTSLRPVLSLEGLRISNPEDFEEGDFIKMNTAEIRVHLLPLLMGKIKVGKLRVKGITVTLLENKQGAVNWSSQTPVNSKSEAPPKPRLSNKETQLKLTSDSFVLTKLVMEDIVVGYHRPGKTETLHFKIDECTGTMLPGKPFILSMKGKLLNEPYVTEIEIGSLQELVEESQSRMEVITEIAKTQFNFAGTLNLVKATQSLHLLASVSGDNLDNLNGLLSLDLPPLQSYRVAFELSMRRDRLELTDFAIQVGKSQLTGMMTADKSSGKPEVTIELKSPLIQLNDFDVGEWSPEKNESKKLLSKGGRGKKSEAVRTGKLISPEVLAKYNVRMDVKADKVISGNDELGGGVLTATLKDGRLSIDPVRLNIPGGSFFLAASLKPDIKAPEASLRATIENFDFGVPVRQARPESNMGGVINLDVDLKSSVDSFGELTANGNGYFDFSGRLENLKAGIIDLWAVNLIAAVISREKENQSKINCLVGRWTMKDGILTSDVLLIDTTKIRICGTGQVNFKNGHIDLKMAPTPKKAEYFNLATPIEVKGNFSDFGVGVQPGGLFGTTVKFITSPVTTTFMRLANKELPSDGNDVCAMPIGPENRSTEPPAGCK
jgi:uncharacterized protein involved in outer membrane biogenesis